MNDLENTIAGFCVAISLIFVVNFIIAAFRDEVSSRREQKAENNRNSHGMLYHRILYLFGDTVKETSFGYATTVFGYDLNKEVHISQKLSGFNQDILAAISTVGFIMSPMHDSQCKVWVNTSNQLRVPIATYDDVSGWTFFGIGSPSLVSDLIVHYFAQQGKLCPNATYDY